jgi:glutamate synthase (ferredoxin)
VIAVKQAPSARYDSWKNVIIGNTVLYGATGGELFVAGRAGERFAVRNSGASAVVEGVGDHGCEYMTGGCVVVIGATGRNFGAGMTGGEAYVLDEAGTFEGLINAESVKVSRLEGAEDLDHLQALISAHQQWTGSQRSKDVLARWDALRDRFWKVTPVAAPQPKVEVVEEMAKAG